MRTIRYISVDSIIRLNARALQETDEPVQLRDEPGLRSLAGRPMHTFDGVDVVPDLIDKAALYLHGLASTQVFAQGNKRTAWAVTDLFLKANGVGLRDSPIVAREAMLIATAIKEAKEFDVSKVSEWLREHTLNASDHLEFAMLGSVVGQAGNRITDLHYQFPSSILGLEGGGGTIMYGILSRIQWWPHEVGSTHTVAFTFEQTEGGPCHVTTETPTSYTATVGRTPVAHWAPLGVQYWSDTFVFSIATTAPVKGLVKLLIDGAVVWQEHLTIVVDPPEFTNEALNTLIQLSKRQG